MTNVVRTDTYGRPSVSASDNNGLVDSLQTGLEVNMVDRACSEALVDLNAYYKVSILPIFSDWGNDADHCG